MGEYSDIIKQFSSVAPSQAAANLDADPDAAAESLDLSKSTGIPAPTINANLDQFKTQYKGQLANQLIRGNSQLDQYIRSHPLAAQISNDDYGNLDQLSRSMTVTDRALKIAKSPVEAGNAFWEKFNEGYGPEPTGTQWIDDLYGKDAAKANPLFAATAAAGLTIPEAMIRGLSGVFAGVSGAAATGVESAATGVTGDPGLGSRIGREAGAMVETRMMSGDLPESGAAAFEGKEIQQQNAIQQVFQTYRQQLAQAKGLAAPWVDAGLTPPAGLHPFIDAVKAQGNAELLAQLNEQLSKAQESFTKERSPEMFQGFVNQHFQNGEIGIDGRVVAELYPEGKVPTADDGLLGWVPGIEEKLAAARATDTDVMVPMADWLARVDPALAKTLNDDIRMWPGGITAREVTEAPMPRPPAVDAPIAQIRDYLGTEPMLSLGDRRVTLEQMHEPLKPIDESSSQSALFHDFSIKGPDGQSIGTLSITQNGKQLYVDWVGAFNGFGPRDIGPSAIRDMLRQLKTLFPEAEEVTGHRVSGARGEAGTYHQPSAHPKVKLDEAGHTELPTIKLTADGEAPPGWGEIEATRQWKEILDRGYWEHISGHFWANVKPLDMMSPEELAFTEVLDSEVKRVTGGRGVVFQPVQRIEGEGKQLVHGLYYPTSHEVPKILVALFDDHPLGTARHEAIHFLRHSKLLSEDEWRVLSNTALEEGWLDKFGINNRYSHLPQEGRVEEAIAEGYREWASREDVKSEGFQAKTPIEKIFQRMKDWWEGVKKTFREKTGQDPTFEDIFKDIHSGELAGSREPKHIVTDPTTGEQIKFDLGPEEKDALQTQLDDLRASGAGLDVKSYARIQKLIRERYESDLEAAMKRAEKEQAKRQGDEWKGNFKEVRKEVEANIRQRPDVAADLFFGSGELLGHKLEQKYRIATDSLTEEQRAALPRHYYGKEGLPLDGLAHMFGFPDGDSMVTGIAKYNALKGDLTPQEMLGKVVKAETERQMEARFGFLEKNILEDAKDQALSDTDINILAEELQAAGMLAKTAVLDKDAAAVQAYDIFKGLPIGSVSSDKFMQGVARHAREIERNLLAGDNATALIGMQKKLISMMLAQHARRLEKELKSFEKVAKTYSKREVAGVEPEYLNYVHRVLMQIGKPVRRSIQDLAKETEARATPGAETFEKFVDAQGGRGREMPVWPQLFDDTWRKEFETLTTEEFRAVRDSLKTMIFHGRDEMKIIKQGEAADLLEVVGNMIQSLGQFKELKYDVEGDRTDTYVPERVRSFIASHFKLETILNRWDQFEPEGVWNQYVMRPLFEGANQEDAWRKEYAKRLVEAKDDLDLNKTIANNLFRDPARGELPTAEFDPLERMSRANLRVVMLNMGTEMNFTKLAKGYNLERDAIEAWVHTYATAEDWAFVQKIWGMFREIKDKSDTMYRSMTGGVPAQDVPGRVISSPKHGEIKGSYYPLIAHPVFESKYHRTDPNALFDNHYTRASTPAGYMEQRTGAIYPLSLSLDALPGRLAQMLHDVALRPAVIQASKVFYNSKIKAAVRTHYGKEYSDMLEPYLRDIANSRNYMPKDQQIFTKASEVFRQNMITTLVGLNPGTVMKHGPTAWVQSMQEVGYKNFMREVQTLFSIDPKYGESNWEFAKEKSLELQRRDRHWQETLGGAVDELVPKSTLGAWRQRVMYWSAKPVALSDMISAVPTWLAKYKEALANGKSEGDAVYLADRSVRRAHGSTSIADRPAIMRGGTGWLTAVYNFFNHIMNRQAEMVWKAGEMMDLAKEGEWGEAKDRLAPLTSQLFAYVLFPALVEEMVAPLVNAQTKRDQKEHSWERTAAMGLAFTLSASWVGVRDVANAILHGSDPSVGLASTALKTITDFGRDWGKKAPLGKDHAGRMIRDGMTLIGALTGLPGQQLGRLGQFGHDVGTGKEKPRGPWGWLVGLRYGSTNKHSKTFDDWLKGKSQ